MSRQVFYLTMSVLSIFTYAEKNEKNIVKRKNFSEIEIKINENFNLDDISSLKTAPGGEMQISPDGQNAVVQISDKEISKLTPKKADYKILRDFILVEANKDNEQINDTALNAQLAACSGSFEYEYSDYNVFIEENTSWYGSGIDFSSYPTRLVSCIDIHYEVRPSWSYIDVAMSEEDYNFYTLEDYVWGGSGDIIETKTGISAFNGEAINQAWYLWAAEYSADGSGYIDYWWIKLYYEGGTSDYCDASGGCDEYISRVQVGDVDNFSGCSGYADYTSFSTEMAPLESYPITVTNGNPYSSDQCGIWVDWNQDKDFDDAGETISVSGNPGNGPYTATIIPPADANVGDTRMRVRIVYNQSPPACGTTSYGEVEDYTITVVEAGPIRLGGYVITTWGDPIPDMEVTANPGGIDVTDSNGYYEFEVDSPYYGTIGLPTNLPNWTVPFPVSLFDITADKLDIDFICNYTGPTPVISGYIKDSTGRSIYGVEVAASTGETTTTDPYGYYELELISLGDPPTYSFTGTVTPSKDFWDFVPVSIQYDKLLYDIADQNYVGTYQGDMTPTISGYVKTPQNEPVEGIEIATDDYNYSITDSDGYYELLVVDTNYIPIKPWSGTVEAYRTDWSFSPPNNVYTDLIADATNQNFTAEYSGAGCDNGWLEEWVRYYDYHERKSVADAIADVVIDNFGNIYVAGESFDFETDWGFTLVKYDPHGNLVWESRTVTDGSSGADAITVDKFGNVYMIGEHTDYNGSSCVTFKYAPDSNIPLWTAEYDDYELNNGKEIVADDAGNVYVLCQSYNNSSGNDIVLIKYGPDSNQPVWEAVYDGPAHNNSDYPTTLIYDPSGYIYVTGKTEPATGDDDILLLKYSVNSNVPIWAATYNGPDDMEDEASNAAFDNNGNIYVTGTIETNNNSKDIVILKFDPNGNLQWSDSYDGSGNDDWGNFVAFDKSNGIYVTGSTTQPGGSKDDAIVLKYDADSNQPQWISIYSGAGDFDDRLGMSKVDEWGFLYTTGIKDYDYVFSQPLKSNLLTCKYSPYSNVPLWMAEYTGPFDLATAGINLDIDLEGDVVVISYYMSFLTIKYSQCCEQGDFNCDKRVDGIDLDIIGNEWLYEKLNFDIAPSGSDGHIDFLDWSELAASWQSCSGQSNYNYMCDVSPSGGNGMIDEDDLEIFIEQWQKTGLLNLHCDIYPMSLPDGFVNFSDFSVFAANWYMKD